ncbi:complex I subunit 4 family protein [Dictyobacter arantiisoli]|uniref:NADH-quinone oxidoreductase subunit M n=1 Tax=Dictyobacter arantiisoli TaxID=2014874 RepID=A0A5A5T5L3_9CHLR|nr:NADH-quinone oxidoreductase subunit M [Dictyobacter arantiisoli]GCF06652.1 NADH-quinone oxidoreductase subunit M [Dictyobacter arantiisoli]
MAIFGNWLTWIILLPVLGAIGIYVVPKRYENAARWTALVFSAATFVVAMGVFFYILHARGINGFGSLNDLPYAINLPWINFAAGTTHFTVHYFLGVDGLSLPMVILNALLTMLSVIGGWKKKNVRAYMALLLLLEAGVMGVFMALDIFFFFLMWEVELAPMFILIGVWGSDVVKHGVPGRVYSAWKFLLYTFFGSVFMLAGFILLYFHAGSSDMTVLSHHLIGGSTTILGVSISLQLLTFLLVFIAFAVKIPMFPFHTWLPDAHTDAPTEVSVLLAGVLLKMGAYGLIRFCFTLFPGGLSQFAGVLAVLAVINILYGAAICLVQTDMKKLIAYSSVSHMGIILLGVAAAAGGGNGFFTGALAGGDLAFRQAALTGATLQMFSHGIITGMLFFCVGVVYDLAHTREIAIFGGIAKRMPMLGTLFTFAAMASLGLPGLAGFVAEYMVFTSSFRVWTIPTILAVFTMILTAAYLLWMIKRVFFGTFNKKWDWLPDISKRELIPLFALAGLIVFVGIYPAPLINVISSSLTPIIQSAVTFIK